MFWRGRKPFLATDDMTNAHVMVVHDIGKMVGGETVGLEQHLVVEVSLAKGYTATHHIVHCKFGCQNAKLRRGSMDTQTHDMRFSRSCPAFPFRARDMTTSAVIHWHEPSRPLAFPKFF